MLAPRASSAFVCIRCELQRAWPRLPALPRRPSHANFSGSARRHDASDTETAQTQRPRPWPHLSEHPLGRLRKRRGKAALRATTARLEGGVKTLGDDAEILVLKEVGDDPSEESFTPEIVPATPQKAINIAESLQQEKRPVSPSEIVQQLNSLRPETDANADANEPHYVSQTTYVKLSRRLLRGFTGQQLSQYYSITKGVKPKQVGQQVIAGLKELQSQAKRPAERSEWHPGTTQIDLRLPGLDVHRKSQRKAVSKHLLVDQILRDLWKLVLLEEIEAPGELELSLKPWQLTLLSSGSNTTPLDRIGKNRRAKIEIYWPHNVLRITSDKNTAEYAADDVEQLLQNTETKRFHLKPWIPYLDKNYTAGELVHIIPEKSLNAVTSLTGATVQVAGGHQFLIRALDKSAVEEAERCLIRLLPMKKNSTFTIDATRLDATKDQSYIFPVTIEKSLLDFQTHHLTLGRWSLPVARTPTPTNTSREDARAAILRLDSDDQELRYVQAQLSAMLKKSARSPIPPKNRQAGEHEWAFAPEDRLMAQFGQVLFPLDSVHAVPETMTAASFVPSLPGLGNILIDENFELRNRPSAPTLEYTFVAAPEQQNFAKDQDFPTLNVQFRYNERTGQYFLGRLSLGFDERIHDVLLPYKSLDIRFYRHTRLRLRAPGASKMVADFMQTVLANIQSGEKLTAPNLTIDIPKWTIPGFPQAHLPGTRSVKYLFTGIRFRQRAAANLLDNRITISTMQSGKLGKKGVALSTFFDAKEPLGSGEHERKEQGEDTLKAFVAGCFEIVDKITAAAASNKSIYRGVNPRDELSARKIRRQELGDVAEQGGVQMVEGITGQDLAGTASVRDEQQSFATVPQLDAKDVEDTRLSYLHPDEPSSDQHDQKSQDSHDDPPDQEANRSLEAAA